MPASTTEYVVRDNIAFITLDNPPVNIMTQKMMDEIAADLELVIADKSLKALAFMAKGKAFCAGADVAEHAPDKVAGMIESFGRMFRLLDALEIPVVMAVHGAAMGGGFELVMMADVLLADDDAKFGQPEIRLGFFAPVGVVELPALVGRAKAMEITCSGQTYSAAEMQACGFVSQVVPDERTLNNALHKVLDELRQASPLVMRLNTRALKKLRGKPFSEALAESEKMFLGELMKSQEPEEGIAAFYEKRRPDWKNK